MTRHDLAVVLEFGGRGANSYTFLRVRFGWALAAPGD